jgi:hypothetical protein
LKNGRWNGTIEEETPRVSPLIAKQGPPLDLETKKPAEETEKCEEKASRT